SSIVAVSVEVVVPSARIDDGDAVKVELAALAVAAAGRIATMTAVESRVVIVELLAPTAPEAAWMTSNEPLAERTPGAPLCEATVARTVIPAGVVKPESPAVP